METLLGTSLSVFLGLTVLLVGGCAFLMGQDLAMNWRPLRRVLVYGALLGVGDRFLTYALFDGELLSLSGYVINTLTLTGIAVFSYRVNFVYRIVTQYPWLYRRIGLFSWEMISRGD
jgi:hypothetical protein